MGARLWHARWWTRITPDEPDEIAKQIEASINIHLLGLQELMRDTVTRPCPSYWEQANFWDCHAAQLRMADAWWTGRITARKDI